MEADFHKLEQDLKETLDTVQYDQILPKVEQLQYPVSFVWGIAGHLNGVKNGDELRAAYEENQPKVVQTMTKISQSKALYNALSNLKLEQDGDDNLRRLKKPVP